MPRNRPARIIETKASKGARLSAWLGAAAAVLCVAAAPLRAQTAGPAYSMPPSIEYGQLYRDVELGAVFTDSKTFPDMIPDRAPATISELYRTTKSTPGFSLADFVHRHFTGPVPAGPIIRPAAKGEHLLDYVASLWPELRQVARAVPPYSTLQPLPYPYVVPGGRFREVYYWDSYFTMLGLEEDGQPRLARDMLKDFSFEIDRYGMIPNGNRSYYLSRSQPPFFSLMVELIAAQDGKATLVDALRELRKEWDFWMEGAESLAPGHAFHNVVRLADGTLLNRYWDARGAPRDESYLEDARTAARSGRPPAIVCRDLRAGAESGWDFSSRWLADQKTLATVRTIEILPVDLNSLLVHLERTLSDAYLLNGEKEEAARFQRRADQRAAAIRRLMWDPRIGAFSDYLWQSGRLTGELTAATLYPLFLHVANKAEAAAVAVTVRRSLLDLGGMATSLVASGQQWDAPNGWAPLQWIAVEGLRNYGSDALAREIAARWVAKNIAGYEQTGKLVEKYDVETTGGDEGGGGEYATQIGFGWTNGVLVALTSLYPRLKEKAEAAVPGGVPAQ
jgi:alpha,alpha-trehalase